MSNSLSISCVANGFVFRDAANTEMSENVYIAATPADIGKMATEWAQMAQEAMKAKKAPAAQQGSASRG